MLVRKDTPQPRLSVLYIDRIGREDMSGYLLKKSSVLGVWKKRFVVISDGNIQYFETKVIALKIRSL